jgi:hypothetical protein
VKSCHSGQPSQVRRLVVLGIGVLVLAGGVGPALAQSANETASVSAVSLTEIQSVMGTSRLDVRRCVTRSDLPSRVDIVVDIVIDTDGTVASTSLVESNAGNGEVEACVLEVIGALLFPQPTNGRTFAVRYPMIFVTGG